MSKSKRIIASAITFFVLPITPVLAEDATGQQLISDWIGILQTAANLLAYICGAAGVILAALSLIRASQANDDSGRAKHVGAALFAGLLTIIFVIIGWISNMLIAG